MLRLTVKSDTPRQVVLEVDGRISGRNVALLESEGRAVLQMDKRLVLDLKGVTFIDHHGLTLLQNWSTQCISLRDGSMFVRELLKTEGLEIDHSES